MPDATPAEFLRQLDTATLNAHVRFLLDVQHAQERLARDLAAIVLGAECAAVTETKQPPEESTL